MFQQARLKLTAWYLLIIMLISISFSLVIFRGLTAELDRLERVERSRILRRQPNLLIAPPGMPATFLDPDVVAETTSRIAFFLIGINLFILGGSAIAGYFLAGRTLKPIAEMVSEQNQFITDASHELRTPLTSLKTEIEVNLRNKNLTIDDVRKLLRSNLEDVNSLSALSDGLIRLTQYKDDGSYLPVEDVKLTGITKEAIRRVSVLAKTKQIRIINSVADTAVKGNSALLTELFVILLDNAIKYSPKKKSITVTSTKTDGHIRIQVIDEGIGVRAKDIPQLFNRFFRTDKSRTKTTTSGYGLGLAIAKQIVDRHKGTILVKSVLGKGTTFTVSIPS